MVPRQHELKGEQSKQISYTDEWVGEEVHFRDDRILTFTLISVSRRWRRRQRSGSELHNEGVDRNLGSMDITIRMIAKF